MTRYVCLIPPRDNTENSIFILYGDTYICRQKKFSTVDHPAITIIVDVDQRGKLRNLREYFGSFLPSATNVTTKNIKLIIQATGMIS